MRIRKRFPFSSMACQASDPQLNNSTLVQQTSSALHPIQNMNDSQPSDPPNHDHPSSDQTPMVIRNNTLHPAHKFQINQKEEAEEASREQEEEENGSNNFTRKEYNFLSGAPVAETRVLPSHQQVVGRWFDGDEKIPMKKRKGVVEKTGQETVLMLEEEEKMKPNMMKSKTNKKCTSSGMQQNHNEQDKAGNDDTSSTPNNNTVKKTNKRGGAIMEGSRCSRVNGRGWRCCQQTLVGYSLCEHHLGKGRLRSISNVKARTKVPAVVANTVAPQNETTNNSSTNDNQSSKKVLVSSSVVQPVRDRKDTIVLNGSCYGDDDEDDDDNEGDQDDDDYNEEGTKKAVVVKKKRMKLGMVKARSLSSLLNQTN